MPNGKWQMNRASAETAPKLARRLGLFDATMIVMGGIIGSGIFMNSYVVARQVHTPFLILGAWLLGGALALAGAFIYAELVNRCPEVGGQYASVFRGIRSRRLCIVLSRIESLSSWKKITQD